MLYLKYILIIYIDEKNSLSLKPINIYTNIKLNSISYVELNMVSLNLSKPIIISI